MSRTPQRPSGSASIERSGLMTRRAALKAMLGITAVTAGLVSSPLRAIAAEASRETTNALNSAQTQLDEAQKKLDAISDEYVSLNEQLNDTVSQIEQVQASIDDTQSQIDAKQAEIADKQDVLASRISSSYKTGGTDFLSVLLNSSNFEELTNNLYYMGKINASDEQLINDVKRAKAEFDSQKAQLESQELAAVQAKQDEASSIVANLSDDVRALMEKRDAEILAAAEEEKRQAAAAEAARKAAAAASSNRGSSGVSGTVSSGNASSKGQAIVNACYRVGSPGSGLCAMWVSQVYSAAGYGYPGGNANNMYWNFCTSSNKGDLQPGMIVAVSTWTGTSAGRVYGHVGIYIGGGMVMHNVGSIQTMGLDTWIHTYGTTVTPRWGWAA